MSLTQNQTDYLAYLDDAFADFRAGLEAALEADNDPATTLADCRTARAAMEGGLVRVLYSVGARQSPALFGAANPYPFRFLVSNSDELLTRTVGGYVQYMGQVNLGLEIPR